MSLHTYVADSSFFVILAPSHLDAGKRSKSGNDQLRAQN